MKSNFNFQLRFNSMTYSRKTQSSSIKKDLWVQLKKYNSHLIAKNPIFSPGEISVC